MGAMGERGSWPILGHMYDRGWLRSGTIIRLHSRTGLQPVFRAEGEEKPRKIRGIPRVGEKVKKKMKFPAWSQPDINIFCTLVFFGLVNKA